MGSYEVPYDRGVLKFELPDTMEVEVIEPSSVPGIGDLKGAVREALASPLGSPPLRELAGPDSKVCIVITDITRASPDRYLVEPVIEELLEAGVDEKKIEILVGVGLHRPSTAEEKLEKLGPELTERFRVIDHNARDESQLVDLGVTSNGVPVVFNKLAAEADLLIATGIVEPHQYAGFSGGRKTVAVGIAGEKMIAYTHSPSFIDHPKTRLANLEGNPFHLALMEIADAAGLKFVVNVVKNTRGDVVRVAAGAHRDVFSSLVETARRIYTVPVSRVYDAVICGVGYPKDSNLYQASRGPSYIFFAPRPVVREGVILIVPAPCSEGAGGGAGEQRFFEALRDAGELREFIERAKEEGLPPGAQRAFVMAKVMEKNEVVVVGSKFPEIVRDAKMLPLPSMEDAVEYIESKFGPKAAVLVVPHSLQTLPLLVEN